MSEETDTPRVTVPVEPEFTRYRRSQIAHLRPYVAGEALSDRVSISAADLEAGSPKQGDMIARNPANHDDQWLVAADYFAANFEPVSAAPAPEGGAEVPSSWSIRYQGLATREEAPKVEQEPINSALAAYGALWCMVTDNPAIHAARKRLLAAIGGQGSEAQRQAIMWAGRNVMPPSDAEIAAIDTHTAPDALRVAAEALEWYGEQARLARLIHSEGDAGRHALADDGGKRARQALAALQAEQKGGV